MLQAALSRPGRFPEKIMDTFHEILTDSHTYTRKRTYVADTLTFLGPLHYLCTLHLVQVSFTLTACNYDFALEHFAQVTRTLHLQMQGQKCLGFYTSPGNRYLMMDWFGSVIVQHPCLRWGQMWSIIFNPHLPWLYQRTIPPKNLACHHNLAWLLLLSCSLTGLLREPFLNRWLAHESSSQSLLLGEPNHTGLNSVLKKIMST